MKIEDKPSPVIRDDLFAAIKYQRPHRDITGPLGLQLTPRRFVPKGLVMKSWERFRAGLSPCRINGLVSAKSLFDDDAAWSTYEDTDQRAIGLCLRFFVNKGMVPLHLTNPLMRSTKLYEQTTTTLQPCPDFRRSVL